MDEAVFDFLADHRRPGLTRLLRAVVRFDGNVQVGLLLIVATIAFLVWRRAWRPLLATALAYPIATVTAGVLKALIDRPRPTGRPGSMYQDLSGSAMPSSHALVGTAVAVAVLLVIRWRRPRMRVIAWSVTVVALFVEGLAMAYVSAHWASDMVVGWAIGAMLGVAVARGVSAVLPDPGPDAASGPEREAVEVDDLRGVE